MYQYPGEHPEITVRRCGVFVSVSPSRPYVSGNVAVVASFGVLKKCSLCANSTINNIAAGIHATAASVIPVFPQLTNFLWSLTTSKAFGCCLECCLHRTKSTIVVNTETNTPTCCLGNCPSDGPRIWSDKKQPNQEPIYTYNSSSNRQRSSRLPQCLRRRRYHVPENSVG